MKLIVMNNYDFESFKNLLRYLLLASDKNAELLEYRTNGHRAFKIINVGMKIVCELIPEYETVYKEKISESADTALNDIYEIITEYKERQ